MSDAPADASPKPRQKVWIDCHFETGFERGNDTITKVRLRKPTAGELRGISIQDVMRGDTGTIITILPRISDPVMTANDAESLEAQDIAEATGAVMGFFMTSAQRQIIEQMIPPS